MNIWNDEKLAGLTSDALRTPPCIGYGICRPFAIAPGRTRMHVPENHPPRASQHQEGSTILTPVSGNGNEIP
jgi:hypothetical protein